MPSALDLAAETGDHAHVGGEDTHAEVPCPRRLERLGLCEPDPSHDHDPQDDFEAFGEGDEDKDAQGKKSDRPAVHAHGGEPHAHSRDARARGSSAHASGELLGDTTLQKTIGATGDPADGFQTLQLAGGEERIVREELQKAKKGREKRRRSLLYTAQTTDWQLVDEESPARVEFLDISANAPFPNALSAAWRPQEAFGPQSVEQSIRQINEFADRSPHKQKNGKRAAMDMVLMTGDQADNQQFNETDWVMTLLEGGPLDPNSGTDPASCPPLLAPSGQTADPALYAGVQDYDDYVEGQQFYDPDEPAGPKYSDWPEYPGLMDRAQEPFVATGLDVPSYVVFGNHDALAQGNQKAIQPFEQVGVGCVKPLVPAADLTEITNILDPVYLQGLLTSDPDQVMLVPPDVKRRYVDKTQYKAIFESGSQPDGHGFDLVDPDELSASNGAASYYAFNGGKNIRLIGIDTLCEGGVTGPSSSGNIDDPQFQWLESELKAATKRDQLVVVFGHHPIRSLSCANPATGEPIQDEFPLPAAAGSDCTGIQDPHGHDFNPGCDLDPRPSAPLHLGDDLTELFHRYPHVIAYVAGHTHENTLSEFDNPDGGAGDFWGIETASLVDWPPQNRLIELMDNCDGTLSFLGTTLDSAAPATAPGDGADASDFTEPDLGSISLTISFNDPQAGPAVGGQGDPEDRNVELLVKDPRDEPSTCTQRRTDGDDDDGGDTGPGPDDDREPSSAGAGGSLPFTGLALLGLLIAALALFASGSFTRWLARRRG